MARASRIVIGPGMMLAVIALVATTAAAQSPQTPQTPQTPPTTQTPQTPPTMQTPPPTQTPMQNVAMGTATTTTEQMSGELVKVEGNNLLVKMANGDMRLFTNVPDSRMALIDGKEVGVRDLKPGTTLTSTITRAATPVASQTTTFGTGKVWHAMGTTVILALPNGDYRQYSVKGDNNKFTIDGKPATMYDLKPGIVVSGEKIVAEPTVEFASNARLVGQNPGSPYTAPASAAPVGVSSGATDPAGARLPSRAADQGGVQTPAEAAAPSGTEADRDRLPNTGGPVPLAGLLGLLLIGSSFAIRRFRS
ncbi:MAG TPA: hypothetical protein VLN08_08180 [Vicinamibacterales bacterium]|nr:hypothetical protein [Vicinamibacterales bacterium]